MKSGETNLAHSRYVPSSYPKGPYNLLQVVSCEFLPDRHLVVSICVTPKQSGIGSDLLALKDF